MLWRRRSAHHRRVRPANFNFELRSADCLLAEERNGPPVAQTEFRELPRKQHPTDNALQDKVAKSRSRLRLADRRYLFASLPGVEPQKTPSMHQRDRMERSDNSN